MTIKEQLTLASGLALALSLSALFAVFQGDMWLLRTLGAILAVVVAGLISRRLGLPRPLQPLLSIVFVAGYLCLVFAGSSLEYGFVPTGHTYDVLRALVDAGRADIQKYAPPVPTSEGLVLLTAGGVGGIAVLVDAIAVILDRAALAGLPLLLLFAVPSAVLPGGLGGLPFVLGAVGWLGLLLVEGSERVGRWGTPMRSSLPGARPGGDDSSLGRVGRRIGFAAVGMAVAIPAIIPGLDHRLVGGRTGEGAGGGGGGSSQATTYNPITRLGAQLTLPKPRTLFVYRTTDPEPDYVRMTTLDKYTGNEWNQSNLVADRNNARVQDNIDRPVGDGGDHRNLIMKIAVDRDHLDVHWLPVPFGPKRIEVSGTWLWDAASGTAFSASQTTRNLSPYEVRASRVLPDRDKLAVAQVDGIDPSIRSRYGSDLPVTAYVKELTDDITKGTITEYDKATAIQAYFTNPNNHFVYDLKASQPSRGGDPLTAFLTGRHGFCEQYATAMAVLLRVAGIPSRVAVGFTPGTQDVKDKTVFTVSTSDAHAWPEAWFAGTGWVRFEPTPAQSGSSIPAYTIPAVVVPGTNNPGQTTPASPTASPRAGNKTAADKDLIDRLDANAIPGVTGTTKTNQNRPSVWTVLAVLAVLALVVPGILTQVRRRRRWRHPGARTAWDQLVDDATDVGYRWHPAQSPRVAAERLAGWRRLPAPALAALQSVAVAAEQARYAPPGRESGADLRAQVTLVRAALQDTSSARTRLRALLFPSSTWQWAYHGIGERVSAAVDRVDDVISTLTRPLRRRTTSH